MNRTGLEDRSSATAFVTVYTGLPGGSSWFELLVSELRSKDRMNVVEVECKRTDDEIAGGLKV